VLSKKYYVDFKLLDVCLRFHSEQKELIKFAEHYSCLRVNKDQIQPHIIVNFSLTKKYFPDETYKKISRNIWLGTDTVFLSEIELFPGLCVNATIKNDTLFVDAFLLEKKASPLRQILFSYKNNKQQTYYKYIGIIYFLIYIPFFYYLERLRNHYLLHASAVSVKHKGILLTGLGGVGKSTFSLGMLLLEKSCFLSDNLIFYNAQKIFPFPEPIALNPQFLNLIGKAGEYIIPLNLPSSHNRMYYQPAPEITCSEEIPKYLFWLQWGTENKCEPLNTEICTQHLLNINLLAKELREYYMFAAALDLSISRSFKPDSYYQMLYSFLSSIDCYRLEFKPGIEIQDVLNETISAIIS